MGQYLGYLVIANGNGTLLPTRNGITPEPLPTTDNAVTTLPFPQPTLTKGTQCPAGTVPLTVQVMNPDGSIGHKTICRRVTTAPQPSPGNDAPEGPRVVRTTTTTMPTTVVVEQPPATTPWGEREWIPGVPNKWLALAAVGAFFFLGRERPQE